MSNVLSTIRGMEVVNKRLEIERKEDFNKLREDVVRAIDHLSSANGSTKTPMQECFDQQQRSKEVNPKKAKDVTTGLKNLSEAMNILTELGRATQTEQKFLKCLHFSNFVTRHGRIEKSHEETFNWMFETSAKQGKMPVRFVEWLRHRSGVYWIEGKAGSGKSTLMKFLYNNPATMSHLKYWAGEKRLVVAQFFFWNAGSHLQKSREGLLRSILFEILRKCPNLLSKVIESVGIPEFTEEESWYEDDLLRIYRIIVSQEISVRFCFFVDGLDEYEDNKRGHEELLDTLRSIDYSYDTKLCVSSRPWVVFQDEFGKNLEWHIKLEDLTRDDIRSFVTSRFNKNDQFRKLKERDPRYPKLAEKVLERAQGVFLWVRLVVRSLLEGLDYHDSVAALLRRLESFPEDLDDFFQHMFDSISAIYRTQTMRTFKIAIEAKQPQSLILYSFVDELEEDPEYCFKLPITRMSIPEIETRTEQMKRRLDGRCKGLLEVVENEFDPVYLDRYKIDFLHRTVRDFLLQSTRTRELIQGNSETDRETSSLVAQARLGVLKSKSYSIKDMLLPAAVYEEIKELMSHVQKATTGKTDLGSMAKIIKDAKNAYVGITNLGISKHNIDQELLKWATEHNFLLYVQSEFARIDSYNAGKKSWDGQPILTYALYAPYRTDLNSKLSADVVKALLEHGADPNCAIDNSTIWQTFMERLFTSFDEMHTSKDEVYEILSLLVNHGASLSAKLNFNSHEGSVPPPESKDWTALYVAKEYFSDAQVKKLQALEKSSAAKRRNERLSLRRIFGFLSKKASANI